MTSNRKTLSLRLPKQEDGTADEAKAIITYGIAHLLSLRATYNRGMVILAPHILYKRHDEPYVDAVVVERDGSKPSEVKLGTFKLSGLRGLAMTSEPFAPFGEFDPNAPRYAEGVIARVGS
ncbi:hypothetical protein PX699_16725 [Sphingobium sp. H39-3-25]|uniref:hypothetical protein n=1 Tax=Sphingomonadales TaxID=204457 RepID=UPI000A9CD000|nr:MULTISPECIES: hypothetical protein [Sphingomonadaceae]MDF0491567.1 hypothetical protein [Sphingomonas pollutisoli]MDF0543998.1 hypothetical protein [Sphingobium arseniciresistens]